MAVVKPIELFDEPACDHNRQKKAEDRIKGCPVPKPGATAGGCAFDGAMITLVPITDVAHLVHGPIACCANSWDARGSLSSGPSLNRHGFTTDLSEADMVFGGEVKLHSSILEIASKYSPAAIFVYSTCVTALTGDDIDSVCKAAEEMIGIPVIPVHAPGFLGSKSLGNRLAGDTLFNYVIGTSEPPERTPYDINLLGEYNIAGELWSVLPLFERLGIRVLSKVSGDSRYSEITWAHRARATMVVCSKALLGLARKLQESYGVPWFEGSFYGVSDMSQTLRSIAKLLDDVDLQRRTEELIALEEVEVAARLSPYLESLRGRRAVLYTGGVKSWSLVSALMDLGIEVVGTGVKKSTSEDLERISALLGEKAVLIEQGTASELLRIVKETGSDILIAGGRNQYTALKGRVPFLDINQERHFAYAGYDGMVELAKRLHLAISSPIWEQVRAPAPWDKAKYQNAGQLSDSSSTLDQRIAESA